MRRLARSIRIGLILATVALWTSTILGGGVSLVGCSTPTAVNGRSTANLTAPGIQDLHVKEIAKILDVIRDVAVDAEAAHVFPTATTRLVVTWHRAALLTLPDGSQPRSGWRGTVLAGLMNLKQALSADERKLLGPYIDSATLVVEAVIQ